MSPRLVMASSVLLLLLCAYAATHPPVPTLATILSRPERYANSTVELYVETRSGRVDPHGFWLLQGRDSVYVRGQVKGLAPNLFVTVCGTFLPDSTIRLQQIYVGRGRRLKMAVSALAVGLLVVGMWGRVRWNGRGLELAPDA